MDIPRIPQPGPDLAGRVASAHEVKARWAWSEIASRRFGHLYAGASAEAARRCATDGGTFADLGEDRWDGLVDLLSRTRGKEFVALVDAHEEYACEAWTRGRLAQAWALPSFNLPEQKHPIPYLDFYLAAPPRSDAGVADPADPRVAAASVPREASRPQLEPAIAVRYRGGHALVEGYLRSILFMRAGDGDLRFLVWAPWRASAA